MKTINLRLSKKPEDLTLKALDITGMMPRVKNSDIQRDLAREQQDATEMSPQRRLKANIDIEKTPQSIVQQKNVALEDFMMKSVYQAADQQELPSQLRITTVDQRSQSESVTQSRVTQDFSDSDSDKAIELETGYRERAQGLVDDQEVQQLQNSIVKNTKSELSASDSERTKSTAYSRITEDESTGK